jgi:hypothetical protein
MSLLVAVAALLQKRIHAASGKSSCHDAFAFLAVPAAGLFTRPIRFCSAGRKSSGQRTAKLLS